MNAFNTSVPDHTNTSTLASLGHDVGGTIVYDVDKPVYKEGDRAEHWYEIVSGAVRAYKLLPDGRRQVIEFYLPGDLFGFDDRDGCYTLSTEAASGQRTVMGRHLRRRLDARAEADPGLSCRLRDMALGSLERIRNRVLVLGVLEAPERVAAFLLEMSDRLPPSSRGEDFGCLMLPMGRKDIADYLGMTPETLSRSMQILRRLGIIEIPSHRRVKILDRRSLMQADGQHPASVPGGCIEGLRFAAMSA